MKLYYYNRSTKKLERIVLKVKNHSYPKKKDPILSLSKRQIDELMRSNLE
jgi:hypothetical protein